MNYLIVALLVCATLLGNALFESYQENAVLQATVEAQAEQAEKDQRLIEKHMKAAQTRKAAAVKQRATLDRALVAQPAWSEQRIPQEVQDAMAP